MPKIAVIGGSGIKDSPLFREAEWKVFDTEYRTAWGDGKVEYQQSEEAIFIPRHGNIVRYGPAHTQYAANMIAAKMLGASVIVSISAVGSLREHIEIKDLVVPDDSWNDSGRDGNLYGKGLVIHGNPMRPSPFSSEVRKVLIEQGTHFFQKVHDTGVYVTIPGDDFGTKIEGRIRAQYAEVVGMTLFPEETIARQLGMHYAVAALPVDVNEDANHERATLRIMHELGLVVQPFVAAAVAELQAFAQSLPPLEQLIGNIIPVNPDQLSLIKNRYLRQTAQELREKYCK